MVASLAPIQAGAHPVNTYYPNTFQGPADQVVWYTTDGVPPLATARAQNATAEWNQQQARLKFSFVGAVPTGGYGTSQCEAGPFTTGTTNAIHFKALPSTVFGSTLRCPSDSSDFTTVNITFNSVKNWHYDIDEYPDNGFADFTGIATHEFGHATGFGTPTNPHFSDGDSICDGSLGQHTMCSGATSQPQWNRLRTLEQHDMHTFVAAYSHGGFVGVMKVKGSRLRSGEVTVTGGQPANQLGARSQTVSSGIATANKAQAVSGGNFSVWTGPRPDNGWKLDAGTYDLNWFDGGSTTDGYAYTNHNTWNFPLGDCTTQSISIPRVSKLGTVTVDTNGNISAGAGTSYVSYDSTTKYVTFRWNVTTAKVSESPKESGICISEPNSQDKNMAPITVI